MARNTRELAQRPAVDPHDEPSAEWGWHGGFPRGMVIAGWVSVFILLVMQPRQPPGPHRGPVAHRARASCMAIGLVLHSVSQAQRLAALSRPWPGAAIELEVGDRIVRI